MHISLATRKPEFFQNNVGIYSSVNFLLGFASVLEVSSSVFR